MLTYKTHDVNIVGFKILRFAQNDKGCTQNGTVLVF